MAKIGAAFVLWLFVACPFAAALKLEAPPALEVTSSMTALERYTLKTQNMILHLEKLTANQTARANMKGIPGLDPALNDLLNTVINTLLQPVQDAVNNSLTQLNGNVDTLFADFVQRKELLLASSESGWDTFVATLNSTLSESLDTWGQINFRQITGELEAVGASGQVPAALTGALQVLTGVTQTLADIKESVNIPALVQSTSDHSLEMETKAIQPYLDELHRSMTALEANKDTLKTSFGTLVTNLDQWLRTVPGHQWVPDSVFENVHTMLHEYQPVVDHVADTLYDAAFELATGFETAVIHSLKVRE
jgi:hypothetical protein